MPSNANEKEGPCCVWFVHKRFCGINAKPFAIPLFSQEEAERFKAILHQPVMQNYADANVPAGETVNARDTDLDKEQYAWTNFLEPHAPTYGYENPEDLVDSLVEGQKTRLPLFLRSLILRSARLDLYGALLCELQGAGRPLRAIPHTELPLEACDPVAHLCILADNLEIGLDSLKSARHLFRLKDEWCTELLHKGVVFASLQYLQHAEILQKPVERPGEVDLDSLLSVYLLHAIRQLGEAGNKVMGPPEMVNAVVYSVRFTLVDARRETEQEAHSTGSLGCSVQ
ncbi:hypothetical protein JCM8547_005774 [Rhodosporidiobolus lusitaniae]